MRARAFTEGFRAFPVSLPFAPATGAMTAYERAFYAGWIEAALADLAGDEGDTPCRT